MSATRWVAVAALFVSAAAAQGIKPPQNLQGEYPGGTWVNYETPQQSPLAVTRIGPVANPEYYLLACNTEDNRLEVFSLSAGALPTAVDRVPVGLHPVSVRTWEIDQGGVITSVIYTANQLGDSVSALTLTWTTGGPVAKLIRTVNVGDEPSDIAIDTLNHLLYVTLSSRNALTILDAASLASLTPYPHFALSANVPFTHSGGPQNLNAVLAQPRAIELAQTPGGQTGLFLFALGSRGTHHDYPGTPEQNSFHDREAGLDLWWTEMYVQQGTPVTGFRKRLGTKNFNMAFDSAGALFVVSGDAQNRKLSNKTKAAVQAEPTGFLRTLLHVIETPSNATSTVLTRNLNEVPGEGGVPVPVPPGNSLSHAVDVAVFESGSTYKVYVTAFHNSALGVLDGLKSGGSFTAPLSWSRTRIDLSKPDGDGRTFPGPTGLAVTTADPGNPNDPGDRVYVLGRFDAAIDVVDATTDALAGTVALQNDPTPLYIKEGRRFLHGAEVPVGNGFNACASCHFDGRTDALSWDLSGFHTTAPFSDEIVSALDEPAWASFATFAFGDPKGEFITQSLQGLVESEVEDPFAQFNWFSDAPYHWDMDMADIATFNEGGFQDLLGGAGLSDGDMAKFVRLVNSIHYPPNRDQPEARVHSGDMMDPNTRNIGTGGLAGLKHFHIAPIPGGPCGNRSCVMCHTLPEGSNNLSTEDAPPRYLDGKTGQGIDLPIETAQVKGLDQREALHFHPNGSGFFPPRTTSVNYTLPNYNIFGEVFPAALHFDGPNDDPANALAHTGAFESINDFVGGFNGVIAQLEADTIVEFLREFDTGTAPMVGKVASVDVNTPSPATTVLPPLLDQVGKTNIGLAVFARIGGQRRGFWCMPGPGPGQNGTFFEIPDPMLTNPLTVAQLLGLLSTSDDLLVFQATPLGMERRIANPAPVPEVIQGSAPSGLAIETMVPNTAYERVPDIEANWDPNHPTLPPFTWFQPPSEQKRLQTPWDLKAIRYMQAELGPGPFHHEAPRRFRVSGRDIRAGAFLRLHVPVAIEPLQFQTFDFPLYPSDQFNGQNRIWETAVEGDPRTALMFAMGGYWARGLNAAVAPSVLLRETMAFAQEPPPPGFFARAAWNRYTVEAINEDGTSATATDQAIDLEPPGWSR